MASCVSVSTDAPAAPASRIDELQDMKHSNSCLYNDKDKNITFQACDCKWCGNILVQAEDSIYLPISLAEKICNGSTDLAKVELSGSKSLEERNALIERIKSLIDDYKIHHWMDSEDGIAKPPGLCPCCWVMLYH